MLSKEKIVDWEEAQSFRDRWKSEGLMVVFTNGCFDLLHLGHIDYLEKARNLGHKLVLGLNDDASVKILKGPSRPINNLESRSRMLAAFAFVDLVVPFSQETPKGLIEYLLPDILVKGKDYDISNIVGADTVIANGGRVETIEFVEGYSTTSLIDKIRNV